MNRVKNKYWPFVYLGFCIPIVLTGCLKDAYYDDGKTQATDKATVNVISIGANTLTATDPLAIIAFNNTTRDTVINVLPVELGGPETAAQDLHITLEKTDSLVDHYNEVHETDYEVSSQVTIVDPQVLIPRGSRTGYLQTKLVPNNIIGMNVALGVRIKSIAEEGYTISSNLNTGIASLLVKNEFDGRYLASGMQVHPTAGGAFQNKVWNLQTTGARSVSFQVNSTALFSVIINVSIGNDNKLALTSSSVALDPYDTAKNYYDANSKTFYFDFGWSGTRHLTAVVVYNGPR